MSSDRTWFANRRAPAWGAPEPDARALEFHRRLPGYATTPLVELPRIARELGVGRVFAKVESQRLGLPAFKALGASWAVRRVLDERACTDQITIVAATDGNHGRAVARFACDSGQRATVFVPDGVHRLAIDAIRAEGADVVEVGGSYDDAVSAAARLGETTGHVLVQDTAWDGYEDVPGWIVDGYETLFAEIDDQLGAVEIVRPDLVVVPGDRPHREHGDGRAELRHLVDARVAGDRCRARRSSRDRRRIGRSCNGSALRVGR